MRITFNIPAFTRNERNSHCDVLHITPDRVANIVLDDAIAAIQIKAYCVVNVTLEWPLKQCKIHQDFKNISPLKLWLDKIFRD